ncbi:MAG: DUF4352 domain-containing protein [Streptosporangiales bacterium]
MSYQPQFMPPQPPPPARPPKPRRNGLAVAALVLGIIGVVFALIPLFGIFMAVPLGILALVFGGIGMVFAFGSNRASKGISTSGTALGAAAIIVAAVMTTAVFSAAEDVADATDGGGSGAIADTPQPSLTTQAGDTEKAKEPSAAGVGDKVRDGDLQFKVKDVEAGVDHVGDSMFGEDADGQYVIVKVAIKNVGSESATIDDSSQYLYATNGKRYDADGEADFAINDDGEAFLNDLNPGNKVKVKFAFDLPKNATPDRVRLAGDLFSSGVNVSLR